MEEKLRVDMSYEDEKMIGVRDAVHMPVVYAKHADDEGSVGVYNKIVDGYLPFCPILFIKFTDSECTRFIFVEKDEDYDGFVSPFFSSLYWRDINLEEDILPIFLRPDIVGPTRHHFSINVTDISARRAALNQQLKDCIKEDPECAECYAIEGGEVVRY